MLDRPMADNKIIEQVVAKISHELYDLVFQGGTCSESTL